MTHRNPQTKKAQNHRYYFKHRERLLAQKREYNRRPKVRERQRRHNQTPRHKELTERNHKKPEVHARRLLYWMGYNRRPEVRERDRARYRRRQATVLTQKRIYHRRPDIKERERVRWELRKLNPKTRLRDRVLDTVRRRNAGIQPRIKNRAESAMEDLLHTHFPGNWRYTGQGDVVIGRCAPDFFQTNGKKGIIELYGCYYHGCQTCVLRGTPPARPERDARRIQMLKDLGYKTLVVWEHELKNPDLVIGLVRGAFYT